MYAGKIIEQANVADIFDRPFHPYTIGLQRSMPGVTKPNEKLYTIPGLVPDMRSLPRGCRFSDRCEFRQEKCSEIEPRLEELSNAHHAACHFPRNIS
jgi:peptide/nickel transport system ATP-binding protein